jgi:hypothetical protein
MGILVAQPVAKQMTQIMTIIDNCLTQLFALQLNDMDKI